MIQLDRVCSKGLLANLGGRIVIKALIFDVDGTLAETEEGHRRAFNAAFAEAGLDWAWNVDLYRELYRVTGGKERIRSYADRLGLSVAELSDADIARLHGRKNAHYAEIVRAGQCPLRPGVRTSDPDFARKRP